MTRVSSCAIGNISIDDLVFVDGSTRWAVPGGNAIYSALGMAIWEPAPCVLAPVGPEYPVDRLNAKIDFSHCRPLERTLRNWGLYEEDGSRTFIFRRATRNWIDFSPTPDHLGDLTCPAAHIAPLRWHIQTDFAQHLRRSGTEVISVDPDDRYLADLSRDELVDLLWHIDLFLPSEQDVEMLLPDHSMVDALRSLRDTAPDLPVIGIKCGAEGVVLHAAGDSQYLTIPALSDAVVDVTGAGDAFSGGALIGYARTGSTREAGLYGSVSASFAVSSFGPDDLVAADAREGERRMAHLRERVEAHPL